MKKLIAVVAVSLVLVACSKKSSETTAPAKPASALERATITAKSRLDEFLEVLKKRGADSYSVKASFSDGRSTEQLWISDLQYADGVFTGKIDDDPAIVKNVKAGQPWKVKREEITDWMYVVNGKIHGGFSIDAGLDALPKDKADAIRSCLVR